MTTTDYTFWERYGLRIAAGVIGLGLAGYGAICILAVCTGGDWTKIIAGLVIGAIGAWLLGFAAGWEDEYEPANEDMGRFSSSTECGRCREVFSPRRAGDQLCDPCQQKEWEFLEKVCRP